MSETMNITSGVDPNSWSETVPQAKFRWLMKEVQVFENGDCVGVRIEKVLQQAFTVTSYKNKAVSRHEDWVDVETVFGGG